MAFLTTVSRIATLLWLLIALPCAQAAELTTLVYHDVVSEPGNEPYSVSRSMFVAHMDYLKANGYQPVSLDLLAKVKQGKARLPEKPLLLTFDDALRSYSEFVVPTLKTYGYPSVVSVVGAWADGARIPSEYQGRLMMWSDLQKLRRTPLVEIISHSHDLHWGIPSNPQGNVNAATTTRRYFQESNSYESEIEFRQRIRGDLVQSVAEFKHHLGFAPRAIAWPYGYCDQVLVEEMKLAGMQFHLVLGNGPTSAKQFPQIKRLIVRNTPSLSEFADDLRYNYRFTDQRVIEFSLDPFKGIPDAKQEELLSRLLDRLQILRANTIIVSPFTVDQRAAFFPNRQMPVASNVLNRVLHQILTRLHIRQIYLSLPPSLAVTDMKDLYTDLARLNWFSGVVFASPPSPDTESRIRRIASYYHPFMAYGVVGSTPADRNYDFQVARLDADLSKSDIESRVEAIRHFSTKVLVVLEWDGADHDRELAARLRLLRGLGVRHYGYGKDDYVTPAPSNYIVASEMAGKSTEGKEN